MDRGYETGAVHRGLELLGITGYIPAIQFSNPPEKYGFSYDPQLDAFICPEGVSLTYLAIQKIRFGKRIIYQVDCDPVLRSLRIPFLSLQPLVENAVEHGLLKEECGGKLTVSCVRHMNFDSITISDSGRGIPPSKLKLLRASLYDDSDSEKHIGLRNSYRRLYFMFNRRLSFSINSTEHAGTEIMVTIEHRY